MVCPGPSLSSYENILSLHLAPFLAQILSLQVIFSPPSCSTFWLRCAAAPLPPPPPFLGRVMSKWLDLTSLQVQRHSTHCSQARFFLSVPLPPLPPPLCLLHCLLLLIFFFAISPCISMCVFILSSFTLPLFMFLPLYFVLPSALSSPFWSFLSSSEAALCPLRFFILFPNTNTGRRSVFEVSRQKAELIPIQLHLSRSTLFLDNTVS